MHVADLTVYVPDDVSRRARAAGVPLSRAMRAILLATLSELEDGYHADPVLDVVARMAETNPQH